MKEKNDKRPKHKNLRNGYNFPEVEPFIKKSKTKTVEKEKEKIVKEKEYKVSYFKLYRYATFSDRLLIIIGIITSAICGLVQPYVMVLFGDVTSVVVTYASSLNESLTNEENAILRDHLYTGIESFAIYASISGIVMIVTCYVSSTLFSYTAIRQITHIRKIFFERMLLKDISWYDVNKTGDFATTFTDNLSKIEEGIGEKVATFVFFESVFLSGVIVALAMGWKLALVCLVSLPVSTIIMGIITWLSNKFTKQEMEAYSAAGSIAEEVLTSIRTVVAFDGMDNDLERYEKYLQDAKTNNIKKSLFSGLSNGMMWFFAYSSYALSFWYGVGLILDERHLSDNERTYTAGNMVTVFFCTLVASWNFGTAAPYFEIFGAGCGAAAKVFEVLDGLPHINLSKNKGKKLKEMKGSITFENVSFQYPSRPEVKILKRFSLDISAGETVALVGASGCGKSTCIQLIQRFYDTHSGIVQIDENNIKDLNLTWLRSKIGVVGQEPALFATTIAENIRYGNLNATNEDIERAAKKANAHNFIKSLPQGYNTLIGERGAQMSGGQKQRIAIARALIREPRILLLDEATSALDTTSEAEVQAALDSISGECTTVIIAHRLSTIRNANRIVVVDEGCVIEQGTHAQLIETKGAYYNLVTSQGVNDTDDINSTESNEILLSRTNSSMDRKQSGVFTEDNVSETLEDDVAKGKKSASSIWELMKLNSPEWFFILIGCITSIINGAGLPVYGLVFGDIMGVLANPDPVVVRTESNTLSLYFVLIGIVTAISTFMNMYSFGLAGEKLTLRVRRLMFNSMLYQEMAYFDRKENGVGALCAQLSGEAASVQGAAGVRVGTVLNSVSTFIIAAVIAIYFQWKLALVLMSFAPLILISVFFEQKFTQGDMQNTQKYLETSAKIAVEAIANIRTVASLGCEVVFYENYVESLIPYVKNVKKKMHFRSLVLGFARGMMVFAYAVGMTYGARLMVNENLPYGIVFKVSEIVIVGSWSIGNAFSFSPNFQKGLVSAARIFKLFNRIPDIRNVVDPCTLENVKGDVEYSKIEFSYPTRPGIQILKGLDLSVNRGKTIALVGSSGCGKSTIIQLLERFYDSNAGDVSLDLVDIKTVDLHNLRSHLGIVSQEPNLFDRTIRENIAYGLGSVRDVSIDEIIEAAKAANIHNFITSLPKGYDTNLGSKGAQLSGGQKQRIAIARALIRNPQILLLDEATSALDNESEKIVQESLDNAKMNRTCIIIAHRLTTIQDADLICVLSDGVVVESGKHSELMEKRGHYYKFYKLQAGQK